MSLDLHLSDWLVTFDATLTMINEGTHGVIGIILAVFIAMIAITAMWRYVSQDQD